MATTTTAQRPALKIAWAPIIWIGGLHLAALLAFVPGWFSWSGLALCLILHWVTGGLGICMTYHRLLTHRSFALRPRWLEYLFTIIGTCASEGGPIGWVADHRRHHANSDEQDDTHTPHEGFFWAHMGWWMQTQDETRHSPNYYQKWAPDLYRDPVHRWIDNYHIIAPLGVPLAPDPRRFDESLVGRALDLRRGMAQQPSRLPDLGAPRSQMVGIRYDVYFHLDDEGVPDRVQHQAGEDRRATHPGDGDGGRDSRGRGRLIDRAGP
jgi:fatty-acid desaturase